MNLKSKKLFTILLALNIVAAVAVILLMAVILVKNKNYLSVKNQSAAEEMKLADVESLKNIVNETQAERDYLSNLFVNKDKIIDFLGSIEALGSTTGADINIVSVDEQSADNPSNTIKVNFTAKGTWAQVFKTVSLIDHFGTALSVDRLEIDKDMSTSDSKDKNASPINVWNANFNITVLKTP